MLELPLLLIDLVASFAIAASSVGLFKLEQSLYMKESIDEKTSKCHVISKQTVLGL